MAIVRLALAGLLGLTVPNIAHAVPLAGKSGSRPAVSSPAGDRQCLGRLQPRLASGPGSLEPLARRMGSTSLRAERV